MPGVFAAGDARYRSIKRVASAVGDGATAVRLVHEYLAPSTPTSPPTSLSRSATSGTRPPARGGRHGASAVAATSAAVRGRHVQRRVGVEEAERPEGEADPLDRHHRPVLRPRDVVAAQRVPEHDVGVLDRPVGRGPLGQPGPAGMLVRVLPGRVTARPPRTASPTGAWSMNAARRMTDASSCANGRHVAVRHQLVADRLAQGVGDARVDDQPVPRGERVDHALRLRLRSAAASGAVRKALPCGFPAPGRHRLGVRPRRRSCRRRRPSCRAGRRRSAGGRPRGSAGPPPCRSRCVSPGPSAAVSTIPVSLTSQLDRAVLVEVPVEGVFVVADGDDERHHQPARPAHLGHCRSGVDVLPEDAVVLLVQADGVLDRVRPCRRPSTSSTSK